VLLWLAASAGFALYVANFANYSNTYGALGGVIVLMLWFYISALILVAAAALVAATLKELHPAKVEAGRRAAEQGGDPAELAGGPGGRTTLSALPAATASAAASGLAAQRRQRLVRKLEAEPSSSPGEWAVAGVAIAVGVALGSMAAKIVGGPDRR